MNSLKFSNSAVLVTGANRGYGEAIAREFLSRLDEDSLLLLHCRTASTFNWSWKGIAKDAKCKVELIEGDLSEEVDWSRELKIKTDSLSFLNAFLISSAGTCGNIEEPLLQSGHMLG